MAWSDGVDRATGFLVTAVNWNDLLGANGSLMQLKSHAHGGTTGEGSQSLGALVLADLADAVAPAAPGAAKTRLYATAGRPRYREGVAGTDKALANDPTSVTGDIVFRDATGLLTRLAIGTANQILQVVAGLPGWQTGVDEDLVKKWALIG